MKKEQEKHEEKLAALLAVLQLKFNGVHRKIVVDDRLPVARGGQLMCSHSTHKEELWVSIIEKAYMKVGAHWAEWPPSWQWQGRGWPPLSTHQAACGGVGPLSSPTPLCPCALTMRFDP